MFHETHFAGSHVRRVYFCHSNWKIPARMPPRHIRFSATMQSNATYIYSYRAYLCISPEIWRVHTLSGWICGHCICISMAGILYCITIIIFKAEMIHTRKYLYNIHMYIYIDIFISPPSFLEYQFRCLFSLERVHIAMLSYKMHLTFGCCPIFIFISWSCHVYLNSLLCVLNKLCTSVSNWMSSIVASIADVGFARATCHMCSRCDDMWFHYLWHPTKR